MGEPAHFHCQYKKFTRGKGQSAVQAAAYRLAARLRDERTDLSHDYTRKGGVTGTLTVTPSGMAVPTWAQNPTKLWNEVEAAEKSNPRALVMHEWEIALPHQLTASQRMDAAREMAQFIADRYGSLAMAAFHNPNRNGDQRNYHVHLMFTPRAIGSEGFSRSKFRHYSLRAAEAELEDKMTGAEEIVFMKAQWAAIGNRHLERAGFAATLDHRSYEEQGVDLEPQKHMGPDATSQERRGERTAKGDFNRAVKDRNRNRQAWRQAWEQARIDITGQHLPNPPPAAAQDFAKAAGSSKSDPPALPRAFVALMDSQIQERRGLLNIHIAERKKQWEMEQEKKRLQKRHWAQLYRRQSKEKKALESRFTTWRQRLLLKIDVTGRLMKRRETTIQGLERLQKMERAKLGREFRQAIHDPADRLLNRHASELVVIDARHMAQRQEWLSRETRNQALLQRLKQGNRGHDPSRGR
ncbi:MAG: MobA/MobL family protein [Nitrospira sp.]|nr:MobA/MobL family protein [Nitrospira sp.]